MLDDDPFLILLLGSHLIYEDLAAAHQVVRLDCLLIINRDLNVIFSVNINPYDLFPPRVLSSVCVRSRFIGVITALHLAERVHFTQEFRRPRQICVHHFHYYRARNLHF